MGLITVSLHKNVNKYNKRITITENLAAILASAYGPS